VLGSIASDVAKHANCDVLIVNTTGSGAKSNG
jgi:nucleotide-binding universal stress UspA family protein